MLTKKSNKIFLLLSLSLFLVFSNLPAIAAEGPKPDDVVSTITVRNTTDFPVWISFLPSDPRKPQQKMDVVKTPITVSVDPAQGFGKPGSVFHFGYKDKQKDNKISYDHDVYAMSYYLKTENKKHFYTQFSVKFEYNASTKTLTATIFSKTI